MAQPEERHPGSELDDQDRLQDGQEPPEPLAGLALDHEEEQAPHEEKTPAAHDHVPDVLVDGDHAERERSSAGERFVNGSSPREKLS